MQQMELCFPVERRPQLREEGWAVLKGCDEYVHETGARFGRRCYVDLDTGRVVHEATVNGGPWEEAPDGEMFWDTLERALRATQ